MFAPSYHRASAPGNGTVPASRRTRARVGSLTLAISLTLSGCHLGPPAPPPPPGPYEAIPSGPSLDVLVLGDWGTGGEGQRALAETMARTHEASPPAVVLTVGDNFYPSGVFGLTDPQWETTFSEIYQGGIWDDVVFRPTFGNHDHWGNTDAQILYSRLEPRWQMPDSTYAFEEDLPGDGSALFIALDTDALVDDGGPRERQAAWLDSVASDGRARGVDWIVAYGHHPIETVGRHGASRDVATAILPALREHDLLYLAGHNHSIELIEVEPGRHTAVCGGGAGGDNDYWVGDAENLIAAYTGGGWCYLRLWSEALAIDLYGADGELRYREVIRAVRD